MNDCQERLVLESEESEDGQAPRARAGVVVLGEILMSHSNSLLVVDEGAYRWNKHCLDTPNQISLCCGTAQVVMADFEVI